MVEGVAVRIEITKRRDNGRYKSHNHDLENWESAEALAEEIREDRLRKLFNDVDSGSHILANVVWSRWAQINEIMEAEVVVTEEKSELLEMLEELAGLAAGASILHGHGLLLQSIDETIAYVKKKGL